MNLFWPLWKLQLPLTPQFCLPGAGTVQGVPREGMNH